MDVRTSFVIAMGILLFTMYYLEREMEREQIYMLFAGLSVVTGLSTVYMVAKRSGSYDFFMILTVVFVIVAILYQEDDEGEQKEAVQKQKEDKRKKTGAKKGKRMKK
ncbi:MAG: hypothetical protein V3V92_06780 [Candidatus Hydrothermarchaeales archaeon]